MASPMQPPPPYTEKDTSQVIDGQKQFRVNRKPVARQATIHVTADGGYGSSSKSHSRDAINLVEPTPPLPPRPKLSLESLLPPSIEPSSFTPSSTVSVSDSAPASSTPPDSATSSKSIASSYIQNAYREARHFAGGLITHPTQSTRHFTILRHSHGLVFYKGTSTSLAISIFSDSPLPPDRTLWLQNKGWTGKTGMRTKALLGRNGNWLNVTPTIEVSAEQLNTSDERAWQRDITSFRKKAQPRIRDNHILQETAVVRIPVEAEDGYFQIVLCMGDKKKVICPSPVFRILSTSRSPSSIRGASLSTLPLELGAMVLSTYAANTIGRVVSPVTSTIQGSVSNYMPSWKTQQAAMTAYDISGAGDKVNTTLGDANSQYNQSREQSLLAASGDEAALQQGPPPPYPIRFFGRGQNNPSNEVDQSSLPASTLSGVDTSVLQRFYGHYFGWARRSEKSGSNEHPWHQAAISVLPIDPSQLTRVSVAQASKRIITIRLITEDADIVFDQTPFEILVMGFIRPDEPMQRTNLARGLQAGDEAAVEAAMLSEVQDVSVVQIYLDHPSWSPDSVSRSRGQAEKTKPLDRAKTTYANTRMAAQNRIDRIPLNMIGVRTLSDSAKDKLVITNGFFVSRGMHSSDILMN